MSLPFTRSLRSLEADSYHNGLLGLLLVAPLFVAWLIWFATGNIALHEVSGQLDQTRDGLITAKFDDGLPPLMTGVGARLHLQDADGNDLRVLPAYVHRFVPHTDGSVVAHIDVLSDSVELSEALTGEVAVEIETVSPVQFLWNMLTKQ
ncbi:MAG: hypothetical protein ACPG8W_00135 [Candidatus Promineifilaceae bacterium]